MYPFIPAHVSRPKECKKIYLIQLPKTSKYCIDRNEIGRLLISLVRRGIERTEEHEAAGRATV